MKIAILGATGYIGKSLTSEFIKEKNSLFLFSRSKKRTRVSIASIKAEKSMYKVCTYQDFHKYTYDIIINCTGAINTTQSKVNEIEIFSVTEEIDNMVIFYLRNHKKALYINMSSGAVYGENGTKRVTKNTKTSIDVNNIKTTDYYSIAKINSEAKHRSLKEYNIVDIRVFSFFSRFVNLKAKYLMSEIVDSIVYSRVFKTNQSDVTRDYIGQKDLYELVKVVYKQKRINSAFDVYSLAPISKFKLLDSLSKKFKLNFEIVENLIRDSATGNKKRYYSLNKKADSIGYMPIHTSLSVIETELRYILERNIPNEKNKV